MYVDYFKNEIETFTDEISDKQVKKWNSFKSNINEGIEYYQNLFKNTSFFNNNLEKIKNQLDFYKTEINEVKF